MERLRRALRGVDRAESPALPVGEALHPVALAAVGVLVVNDWLLKPRFHDALTGKLSDLAGLAFAPVLLSAIIGLGLYVLARLGVRVDPSLSRRRLVACCVATAAGFALVKIYPPVAELVARAIGHHAEFYPDLTDLFALPLVLVALWIGRDELRRVPLGRPHALHRLGRAADPNLADVRWAGRDTGKLAHAIDAWDVPAIDALLG
ncbi:MAG TPA: hypothetical protein VGG74_26550 [Kofleriaceae bacterium]|jgi:hypothetical protein